MAKMLKYPTAISSFFTLHSFLIFSVPSVLDDDYEYRDFNDYTSGVAIDYAKVSTTKKMMPNGEPTTTTLDQQQFFQKTNRYPKTALRKFRDDAEQRRKWYEALFMQRRR
jgi:hypothetical protein